MNGERLELGALNVFEIPANFSKQPITAKIERRFGLEYSVGYLSESRKVTAVWIIKISQLSL